MSERYQIKIKDLDEWIWIPEPPVMGRNVAKAWMRGFAARCRDLDRTSHPYTHSASVHCFEMGWRAADDVVTEMSQKREQAAKLAKEQPLL